MKCTCEGFVPPSETTITRTVFKKRGWIMRNLDRIRSGKLKGVEDKLKHDVMVTHHRRRKQKKRPRWRFRTVHKGLVYACRTCGKLHGKGAAA